MFDPYAKFEPQKTVFRDHDLICQKVELKAASPINLETGSILVIDSSGYASLATDSATTDDLIGVLFGAVHLDSTPTTSVIAIHCDCVKDQCKVASGSNIDTIAKTLRQMGIFVH